MPEILALSTYGGGFHRAFPPDELWPLDLDEDVLPACGLFRLVGHGSTYGIRGAGGCPVE